MSGTQILALIAPVIATMFAIVFLIVWSVQRRKRYILFFSAAAILYALASATQIFMFPPGAGPNTTVSAILFIGAIVCFAEGLLRRAGAPRGRLPILAIAVAVFVAVEAFYFVFDSLTVRIYVLNFGCGFLFIATAIELAAAGRRRTIDRVVFWVVLVAGLHFFPRTVIALEFGAPIDGVRGFFASAFWFSMNFSLVIVFLVLALTLLAAIALDSIDELKHEGHTDFLTSLLNRGGFELRARELLDERAAQPASLVFCDIDLFKGINDRHGHAVGDRVLQAVGGLIAEATRPGDLAARIGGEEFVVLLDGANLASAWRFAERVRRKVEAHRFDAIARDLAVTASFGVAERQAGESLPDLMRRADTMLYAAKRTGRNRTQADPLRAPAQPDG